MQTNTFTRWSRCIAGAGLALVAASVLAQGSTVPTGASPDLVQDTQRWIESTVAAAESANTGVPLKMEVQVGALDSRLRLSPCARVEPYLPVGTRLWGRSRIGLRCLEGVTRWNVFLPVTVKAVGRAWVLRSNVNAGAVLTSADAVEAEVDWAEEASPVVLDPALWVGSQASRSLAAGQTLRQSTVRAATAFTVGTQVRVVAQGRGFNISTDAQALGAGVVGQSVRVRMEGGRIVSGRVLDARTVKLDL
jgi:flagella basal body P-ring formation protein FlgA